MQETPEAIDVVSQTKKERLLALGGNAASGSFCRQFAFDHTEDGFGMNAPPVFRFGKGSAHLSADAVKFPTGSAPSSGNDALGTDVLADVKVVALAVKLRIGEHQMDWIKLRGLVQQRSQHRAIIGWALMSPLRQHGSQIHINSQEPFEPVTLRHRLSAMLFPPPHKKGADGTRRKPGGVHRHCALLGVSLAGTSAAQLFQTPHHFGQSLSNDAIFHSQHETIKSAVVG
jgi:hypothetical protein